MNKVCSNDQSLFTVGAVHGVQNKASATNNKQITMNAGALSFEPTGAQKVANVITTAHK